MDVSHLDHLQCLYEAGRLAGVVFHGVRRSPLFVCHIVSPKYLYMYDYRAPLADITTHTSFHAAMESLHPYLHQIASMEIKTHELYKYKAI
jgi:hypothetical protein